MTIFLISLLLGKFFFSNHIFSVKLWLWVHCQSPERTASNEYLSKTDWTDWNKTYIKKIFFDFLELNKEIFHFQNKRCLIIKILKIDLAKDFSNYMPGLKNKFRTKKAVKANIGTTFNQYYLIQIFNSNIFADFFQNFVRNQFFDRIAFWFFFQE